MLVDLILTVYELSVSLQRSRRPVLFEMVTGELTDFFHFCPTHHSAWLVSSSKEAGPGLLDAAARTLQPNRASC